MSYTNKMNTNYFWFLLGFLCMTGAQAQEPVLQFKTLGIENGFSDSRIFEIVQAENGIVWTASRLGINRYDGTTVEEYRLPDHLEINDLVKDDGDIFVATSKGLYIYQKKEGKFIPLSPSNPKKPWTQNAFHKILRAAKGGFWLAGNGGKFYWCNSLKSPTEFKEFDINALTSSFKYSSITAMAGGKDGKLWIGTSRGELFSFEAAEKRVRKLREVDNDAPINDLMIDQSHHLWIATNGNGLFSYHTKEKTVLQYQKRKPNEGKSIDNNVVLCLLEGQKNRIYIGTDGGGINLFQPQTKQFTYFKQGEGKFDIQDNAILCFSRGMNNLIWAGTVHGGISLFKDQIDVYNISPEQLNFGEDKQGSKILEDAAGNFWITAGRDGLRKYNPKTKKTKTFVVQEPLGNGLRGNIVLSLYQDDRDRIWMGTLRNGINVYSVDAEKFITVPGGESLNGVYSITKGMDATIWVGTSSGVVVLNEDLQVVNRINTTTCKPLSSNVVTSIYKDVKGDMWVGTRDGLNLFSAEGKYKKSFYASARDRTSLSGNYILSIAEGPDLSIYVGTYGFGLNRFSRRFHNFKRMGAEEGLQGNIVRGILRDARDNIWLSTNLGMSQITKDTIINYGVLEGVPPFHGGAASLGSDGHIYFAGNYGLSSFKPEALKKESPQPFVFFTNVKVTGRNEDEFLNPESLPRNTAKNPEVVLLPSYRLFTANFSSTAYLDPENSHYYYKLKGLDNEWHALGNQKSISFSNLAPGDYTLYISTSQSLQTENVQKASLALHIKPSLWQRESVRALAILVTLFMVFFVVSWRNRNIKKQRDKLKDLVAIRTDEVEREKDRAYKNELELLEKEKQNEQLKQKRLHDELGFKTEELTNSTLRSVSKNKLLNQIKDELSKEVKKDKKRKVQLQPLINKIKDSLAIDTEWKSFYNLFHQVHPNFIQSLKDYAPSLTDRELRLCALIKLSFPSKQIATLFGISLSSVKVARHRLRKKLNIPPHISFEEFFDHYDFA